MTAVARRCIRPRGESRAGRLLLRTAWYATRAAMPEIALAAALLTGCSQLEPADPAELITDPTQLYVRLTIDHPAVTLSTDATTPGAHTLQLTATPYNAAGTVIADAPAPTFRLLGLDTTQLKVSANGMLQALNPATGVQVLAELSIGGVRHVDTATVNITTAAPPSVLDTFSIHVPLDSVWHITRSASTQFYAFFAGLMPSPFALPVVMAQATDPAGTAISELAVDYASLDSSTAIVDRHSGAVTLLQVGRVSIVASTMAYGVAKVDTATYTIESPLTGDVTIQDGVFSTNTTILFPATLPSWTIATGGIVGWFYNSPGGAMDVTFDSPDHVESPPVVFCNLLANFFGPGPYCGTGNIAAFSNDSVTHRAADGSMPWRFRQFTAPGTYGYHSTTTGARGQIIVVAPIALP